MANRIQGGFAFEFDSIPLPVGRRTEDCFKNVTGMMYKMDSRLELGHMLEPIVWETRKLMRSQGSKLSLNSSLSPSLPRSTEVGKKLQTE